MANDIDTITPPSQRTPVTPTTQATAIEQSRAVAEVQAAVVVAQQVPRDMGAAEADMRDACSRLGLANRAFYSVPNRGSGPSVHLARELARIFGNVQYGVHELRRDDQLGQSEIQAFAWDVEKNVRSTRTFQVPHQRMKKVRGVPTRDPLVDLTDVYLNNQNIGARAVRECIFTVLPAWYTDLAQELCHKTLVEGEGRPLADRIADMVRGFADLGVSVDQLQDKIGRKRSAWQPGDLAQMTIVYTSIKRGEITKDDAFPAKLITADEVFSQAQDPRPQSTSDAIPPTSESGGSSPTDSPEESTGPAESQQPDPVRTSGGRPGRAAGTPPTREPGSKASVPQQAEINRHLQRLGLDDGQKRMWWVHRFAGLPQDTIKSLKELRQPEAEKVITQLGRFTDKDQLDASLSQDSLLEGGE